MFKMGSHDPFGHLKHKLWPKEGPRAKLSTCLSLFLVPIPEFPQAPLPPKCCEPGRVLQLLILSLFSPFGLIIESIKEFGGASKFIHH